MIKMNAGWNLGGRFRPVSRLRETSRETLARSGGAGDDHSLSDESFGRNAGGGPSNPMRVAPPERASDKKRLELFTGAVLNGRS